MGADWQVADFEHSYPREVKERVLANWVAWGFRGEEIINCSTFSSFLVSVSPFIRRHTQRERERIRL